VPVPDPASSNGSLVVPRSGGRGMAIAIVLLIDVAMVIAGVLLLMRTRDGDASDEPAPVSGLPDAAVAVAVSDAGVVVEVEVVPDAAPARTGTGTGTGRGTVKSSTDAAVPIPTPTPDAAVSAPPDAAREAPSPPDAAVEPPAPDAAPTEPSESLPDQVAVKLRQSQSRLSRCYTQATKGLPEDQPLSGEVDIAFEVMPTGETRNVTVARNTTGSNQLGACISDVVAGWGFDAFTGDPVNMQRTFRFRGST